jgi:hypothetical protein
MIDSTQKNNPRAVQLIFGMLKTASKKLIADSRRSAKFSVSVIAPSFLFNFSEHHPYKAFLDKCRIFSSTKYVPVQDYQIVLLKIEPF